MHTRARASYTVPNRACAAGPTPTTPAHPIPTSHAHTRPPDRGHAHNRDTPRNDTQTHTKYPKGAGGRATRSAPALAPAPFPHAWLSMQSWKMHYLPTSRCAVRM